MSLSALFQEHRKNLNSFFDQIDVCQAEKIFQQLAACDGSIVLSGVGKSGHIAQKIAATLISTGTRSHFLSPSEALHGDLGILGPKDILFLFSKSGQTQELIDLLPHAKKKGTFTIAAVSRADSYLAKACDLSVVLPVDRELCPFDLAPTTSTAVQLIFGDCLAIALMQSKKITITDFAANHPAGFLGRKITLKTADLMLTGEAMPFCRPQEKLIDVLHVLSAKRCGCLLVVDEERHLQGIFTDGDLRRSIEEKGSEALQATLAQLMNPVPKYTAPDQLVLDAIHRMEENPKKPITVLPVLTKGKVVGLIRMHDILQAGLHLK